MKVPQVSLKAWKDLYEIALRYRDLKPWVYLGDDALFGVKDPVTGQIGYCCVLGTLGEILGLCVYRGSEGLAFYESLKSGELNPQYDDVATMQNALLADFTDRRDLEKDDLSIIKALNLKIRGRKQYPLFRSYLPGYTPWFLTEDEVHFLTFTLHCACNLFEEYRQDPTILESVEEGNHLVYLPQEGEKDSVSWRKQFLKPEPLADPVIPQIILNELQLQKIKKMNLIQDTAWEADFFFISEMVIQDNDRPYLGRVVMVAHQDSGFIFFFNLIQDDAEPYMELMQGILSAIEKHKVLPSEVRFRNRIAAEVVKPLAKALNFKITLSNNLDAINEAKTELSMQARTGFPNFPKQ
jgi:hypothetical protein